MIEINLIPDVKLELLKARRTRTTVISASIMSLIASVGVVVLLAVYVFGIQSFALWRADEGIKEEYATLSEVQDLSETLTIQNQLSKLSSLQSDKMQTSRLFNLLTTVTPTDKNAVSISTLRLDTDDSAITMEAEAANGYEALEVFKKTIAETTFEYVLDGEVQEAVNVASEINDGDRSYGQNSRGERVLRFTLSFTYADELFDSTAEDGRIIAPAKRIATDSVSGVPKSLFTDGSGGTE